jgi:hypothetical protein
LRGRLLLLLAAILLAPRSSPAQEGSSPPPDYRAPETGDLCPRLAEDFELCAGDLLSGNCADFVGAAGRLGAIYRSELSRHPGWVTPLRTTVWWGCGSASLAEMGSLLGRIDTPEARAVLAEEPYRSLREEAAAARTPARMPPQPQEPDCLAPATPAERDACAAAELARSKAAHESAFAACRSKVIPALASELMEAEKAWQVTLSGECPGAAYTRDLCLAQAYRERTESIAAMHPECR